MISHVSHEQYRSGFFLLKRLGAERHLDPELAATIGHLRQSLLGEAGEPTAAETMLTDLAVLSYYHVFRIQGWIGDLATIIEGEFFGRDVPCRASAASGRNCWWTSMSDVSVNNFCPCLMVRVE